MSTLRSCWLVPAALLIAAPWAAATHHAAGGGTTTLTNPLDATVAVPRVTYESAFSGYRAYGDLKLQSWKSANDEVGRIGGWRSYAREASETETPAPVTPAAPAKATDSPGRSGEPAKPQGLGGHPSH